MRSVLVVEEKKNQSRCLIANSFQPCLRFGINFSPLSSFNVIQTPSLSFNSLPLIEWKIQAVYSTLLLWNSLRKRERERETEWLRQKSMQIEFKLIPNFIGWCRSDLRWNWKLRNCVFTGSSCFWSILSLLSRLLYFYTSRSTFFLSKTNGIQRKCEVQKNSRDEKRSIHSSLIWKGKSKSYS